MSQTTIDPRLLRAPPKRRIRLSWQDETVRGIVWQLLVVGIVGFIGWWLWSNTVYNLEKRNIATGFDFLGREAGLPIGEQLPTPSWVPRWTWWSGPSWQTYGTALILFVAAGYCVRRMFQVPARPAAIAAGSGAEAGFYLGHLGPFALGLAVAIWLLMGLPAGVELLEYNPTQTYARALLAGLFNTLKVAIVAVVLSTILGTLIGVARLSKIWLLAKLAGTYVEIIRNLPLLLQLLFWYTLLQALPPPRQALHPAPGVFLSVRGLRLPWFEWEAAHSIALGGFAIGLVITLLYRRWATQKRILDGIPRPVWPVGLGLLVGLPLGLWAVLGAPFTPDVPVLRGFNFIGGSNVSPEYFALLIGLVLYTAGFIAEIVRAGILAVPKGQWEAAQALGLRPGAVLQQIVLPQALRVIIPPMTSQYLNVTKNSSLAVAIGYPDIVSIAGTTLNQTGQSIEGIAIIMLVYLTISLSISLFMNWYNAKIALVER